MLEVLIKPRPMLVPFFMGSITLLCAFAFATVFPHLLAEMVGFEPTEQFLVRQVSNLLL